VCRGLCVCADVVARKVYTGEYDRIASTTLAKHKTSVCSSKANPPRVAKNNGRKPVLPWIRTHKPQRHHAPVHRAAFQAKENAQGWTSPVGTVGAAVDALAVAGQLLQSREIFRAHFQGLVRGQAVLKRIVAFFAWHGSIQSE